MYILSRVTNKNTSLFFRLKIGNSVIQDFQTAEKAKQMKKVLLLTLHLRSKAGEHPQNCPKKTATSLKRSLSVTRIWTVLRLMTWVEGQRC